MTRLRFTRIGLLAAVALAAACGSEPERAPGDASGASEQGSAAGLDGALESYLKAQEALADDSFEPARQAVAAMQEHMDPEHAGLAGTAAAAVDIETLRAAFLPLSNALLDSELPDGYRIAHCPMAFDWEGAHWIQKEGEIANPYYGSGMLHCGVFVEGDADGSGS